MKKKRNGFLICLAAILIFGFVGCQEGDASKIDSGQSAWEQTGGFEESSVVEDSVKDDGEGEEDSTSQSSQENEKEETNGDWVDIEFPRP